MLCAFAIAASAAPSIPGDDLLQRRCREKVHDEAFSELISPGDRKSCAFFAEQNAYLPYELKVETGGDATKLKGTVAGVGSYEGSLVACGTASRCLQIEKSPEDKINGALMFYSNAAVEADKEKVLKVILNVKSLSPAHSESAFKLVMKLVQCV